MRRSRRPGSPAGAGRPGRIAFLLLDRGTDGQGRRRAVQDFEKGVAASGRRIARVERAGFSIIAVYGRAATTDSVRACLSGCAGVSVVARAGDGRMRTPPGHGITGIERTGITVVTGRRPAADPVTIPAHVSGGAYVVVVAGNACREEQGDRTTSGETLLYDAIRRVRVAGRSAPDAAVDAAPARRIADIERTDVVVIAHRGVQDMPAACAVVEADIGCARYAIIAVSCGADAVPAAADIVRGAEIAVAARAGGGAARAGAGGRIAGVDRAGVAVIAVDRRCGGFTPRRMGRILG